MKYRIIYNPALGGVYLLQMHREFLYIEWWKTISVSSNIDYIKKVIDNLESLNDYIIHKNIH